MMPLPLKALTDELQIENGESTHSVTLSLPYPISANRYWATRVIPARPGKKALAITYVTDDAKDYKRTAAWSARQAGIIKPFDGRVSLVIDLFPHRPQDWQKRQRINGDLWSDTVQCIDLGNCEKVLSDALNGIAWHDDKQLWDIHLRRREPDEHGARMHVTIVPLALNVVQPELL